MLNNSSKVTYPVAELESTHVSLVSENMLLNQYVVMDSFIHSIHLHRAPASVLGTVPGTGVRL